ncbi:ATP synthase gamma subunit [Tetragenococcus halophilus subsp. halophilus]|uniref:ATP synthase gamma chain n=1 Tax=Tetragenococcus halophilus (strain DSM 20338 / JCM 20259 / NCIMB 9735 / NBRC 12172) TaxID=945021 RepID=A0AAN1VRH7_TETHN|nr:F0F1 ATP synthase subunit gamma [Tetragenococcus halophilus]MCO7027502.1 F0F1 ATP synthase subunit gamma [Tetragenococcus halophilus]NWO00469.1 F0F1 ATP synthase subunit gamma [Tetragenococcus halophilus]BAK95088.1 ATP synthase gamma subunit [Tetragenococcus halophilus NBRC 12172]GBD71021.1 ATP synthase gamma subunit [Tetragenococcus halophilus subsp. halophilus]GBD78999.1 ATP synthase gamma subunit [Tetragenococcus halophilus subsp. halophilus]
MAESLNEIRDRIASTKKTGQITKAMQMVSASKLTKSQAHSKQFQTYANKVRGLVTHIVAGQLTKGHSAEELKQLNPMLVNRPVKRTAYIVITADGGLVGNYNSSILKQMMTMIQEDHDSSDEYVMITIGGTGADFFKARNIDIAYELRNLSDQPSFDEVRKIVNLTTSMYQNEVFDELYVCYNHHVNSLTSQFRVEKMLPISDLDPSEATEYEQEYIFEPSEEQILDQLLPQYAESLIYGAIVDAKTAEHAAGMTAMQTASDNADNIISDLSTSYNRARQGAITQEITEIVGGAAALE